jgi:hypothetical protein
MRILAIFMGLKLSFELTDRDLLYFRESLKKSRDAVRDGEELEIVDGMWHVGRHPPG